MTDFDELVADLKRKRDELVLKIHLGSKDVQDRWVALEKKWKAFAAEAKLHESAADIGAAAQALGKELRTGYEEIRKALRRS